MLSFLAALALQTVDYAPDLDELLADLKRSGAYVWEDKIDFGRLNQAYRPRFKAAHSRAELLPALEALMGELHDFHATLGTNNDSSPRLVPSGTDLFGEWRGGRAFVEQVRARSLASEGGVRPGDEIVKLNGVPIRAAATAWLGVQPPGERGWGWALNSALAGRWNAPRRLTLRRGERSFEVQVATARQASSDSPLTIRPGLGGTLILRPEDSLGQDELLKAFDAAVPRLRAARGIVLDLRNTPSGGNTAVARGIMGLFVSRRLPYQRHTVIERETGAVRDWVEYMTPRLSKPITTKVIVLVNRWTGSMGEGLAIGFDGMRRATVVGTRMAGLRGAVEPTTLPVSGIRLFFPTERTYHVKGIPREAWVPPVKVVPGPGDPWLWEAEKRMGVRERDEF